MCLKGPNTFWSLYRVCVRGHIRHISLSLVVCNFIVSVIVANVFLQYKTNSWSDTTLNMYGLVQFSGDIRRPFHSLLTHGSSTYQKHCFFFFRKILADRTAIHKTILLLRKNCRCMCLCKRLMFKAVRIVMDKRHVLISHLLLLRKICVDS